ncbi:MAG TPA: twin-arginine translocase TatA/TatE family subunit [Terracidiphilus sp.]|nr:twin-arginine translocase TatA/TatE family subunit [Terracidiphilus sp.]
MGTPPPIEVSTLGMADSLILMVLALVVFGPRRLPQIGRQLGKLMYEFRKASNDFKFQMEEELRNAEEADRRKREEEERKKLALDAPAESVSATAEVSAMSDERPMLAAAEEAKSGLQVRPPSTGKTVAAERAGAAAEPAPQEEASAEPQQQAPVEARQESSEPTTAQASEAAGNPAAPATEAVSHNG